MKYIVQTVLLASSFTFSGAAVAAPQCAAEAVIQAKKLLAFHQDPGNFKIDILPDMPVKELAPISDPANKKQKLKVLEVYGYIYKSQYRMRLIYRPANGECNLVGQEVIGG
jgi:hypothetical protein